MESMFSRRWFVPAVCVLVAGLIAFAPGCSRAPAPSSTTGEPLSQRAIDRDLMEVTVAQLEEFYAAHKYTVTEVVRWHMARSEKYNGIYRAVEFLDSAGAGRHRCWASCRRFRARRDLLLRCSGSLRGQDSRRCS